MSAPPTSPDATAVRRSASGVVTHHGREAHDVPADGGRHRRRGRRGARHPRRSSTKHVVLLGGDGFDADRPRDRASMRTSPRATAPRPTTVALLAASDPDLARPLVPGLPYVRAEAVHAAASRDGAHARRHPEPADPRAVARVVTTRPASPTTWRRCRSRARLVRRRTRAPGRRLPRRRRAQNAPRRRCPRPRSTRRSAHDSQSLRSRSKASTARRGLTSTHDG